MAEETKTEVAEETEAKKGGLLKALLVPIIVGVVCAGIGFAIPLAFPALLGVETPPENPSPPEPIFVTFGEVVVNLNEGRMNRYLRLGITLQMNGDEERLAEMNAMIEKKKPILTSWLLRYLADNTMDDIRGATGQNRLRREIHDQFNAVLFPENEDEIQDVLFEEFNVQ